MRNWQEKAEESKERLNQLEDWIASIGWSNLPKGVRMIICQGESSTKENIKKYEEWAKKETQAE